MPRSKLANTAARRRQWDHVEQSILARGGSKASAAKAANAAVRKHPSNKRR